MNANALIGPRLGVMVHYSAGDFASTVAWVRNPESRVSYNLVIAPDGHSELIVPWSMRAWHAGVCRTSDAARLPYKDANSAFEGISLAGGPAFGAPTDAQRKTLVRTIRGRFDARKWAHTETWRIVGHDTEAWPRGRKCDPTGEDRHRPWLDLSAIREAVTHG